MRRSTKHFSPDSAYSPSLPASSAASAPPLSCGVDFPLDPDWMAERLVALGESIRDAVLEIRDGKQGGAKGVCPGDLAAVHDASGEAGDITYAIDAVAERALLRFVESEIAPHCEVRLVAEGIAQQTSTNASCKRPSITLIADPIDGTRGLMTDKRPAWVLLGAAPGGRPASPPPSLADIYVAAQVEIPISKQWRSDMLWAVRGRGAAHAAWRDVRTGTRGELLLRRPDLRDIRHRFVSFAKFFPGARDAIASLEEEMLRRVLGPAREGLSEVFEDQYISTGGQLYELLMGRDAFIADIRPLFAPVLRERGLPRPLACHPYDLAAALVAEEAGIVLADGGGKPLTYPLDTHTECSWIGYASPAIRAMIEPVLLALLRERGLGE